MPRNTLLVTGPHDYTNREVIVEALIDTICLVKPTKVITGNSTGVSDIVAEMINLHCSTIEYERVYANRDKFGANAVPRRNYAISQMITHALVFYNGSAGTSNMLYFIKRFDIPHTIINI